MVEAIERWISIACPGKGCVHLTICLKAGTGPGLRNDSGREICKISDRICGEDLLLLFSKMLGELHSEPDQIHKVNLPSLDVFYATQIRKCSISRKEFDAHLPGQEIAESISIRYVMAFAFEFQPQLHRTRYIF